MTDTAARNPTTAPQMLADALLRSVGGSTAQLRVTATNTDGSMSEVGIVATTFSDVVLSPVVLRKLRPTWRQGDQSQWELLVSATSVQAQVSALSLASAQSLFAMTLTVTVTAQDYLIDNIASNEVFGQVYLYRLLLREAREQAV
jgi:predicted transglutaminase-like cysteine proteinase